MSQNLTPLISEFLFDRQAKNRTKTTIRYYQVELKYFSDWLGDKTIEEITPKLIKQYLIYKSETRNKGGVHSCYRSIKAFFNWYDEEYDSPIKNPINKVKIKPNNLDPIPEYPLEAIQGLLQACKGRHMIKHIAMVKCLLDTGCRSFEFCALNYGDVNLETGKVDILHGKGDKHRIVWLGVNAKKTLKSYLLERENLKPNSPLFETEDENRFNYNSLKQVIKRLCKNAGVKYTGIHSFRRCTALSMWRQNVDIITISRYLGHQETKTTLRYLNIQNEELKDKIISPADSLD